MPQINFPRQIKELMLTADRNDLTEAPRQTVDITTEASCGIYQFILPPYSSQTGIVVVVNFPIHDGSITS